MKIFLFISLVFIVPMIPKLLFSCEYLVGTYQCGGSGDDGTQVEILESAPYSMKQTKLGIALGPLELDNTLRTSLSSNNVEVVYQGNCIDQENLKVEMEQIYFGGFKVRFDHELYAEDKKVFLRVTNYRTGNSKEVKTLACN